MGQKNLFVTDSPPSWQPPSSVETRSLPSAGDPSHIHLHDLITWSLEILASSGCVIDTLYTDASDCTKFYMCSPFGLQSFNCPTGLHFNPFTNYCDWPNVAGCTAVTIEETLPTSTDKNLFSDADEPRETENEHVNSILSANEKLIVNDTEDQLLEETTEKSKITYDIIFEYATTLDGDFNKEDNKTHYLNSHNTEEIVTDTHLTNEMFTDNSIIKTTEQNTDDFSRSFISNSKEYSTTSAKHNLRTSKIPGTGLNLKDINSELYSTSDIFKSSSEVTTGNNYFSREKVTNQYLKTTTNSEIVPEINENCLTIFTNLQEVGYSRESSVAADISSHTDASLTNTVVSEEEIHLNTSSILLSSNNAHSQNFKETTLSVLESSSNSIDEGNDSIMFSVQTSVTSQNVPVTDKFTDAMNINKFNSESPPNGFVSSLYSTISDEPTIIHKETEISSPNTKEYVTVRNENYDDITNSNAHFFTKEDLSILVDESPTVNGLDNPTTLSGIFNSLKNNSTIPDLSQVITTGEYSLPTQTITITEKLKEVSSNTEQYITTITENYAVNQYDNTYKDLINDKSTMSVEVDAEALTAISESTALSNGTPSTPHEAIKTTENIYEGQYDLASSNPQDLIKNMSHTRIDSTTLTTDISHSTSNLNIKVNEKDSFTLQTNSSDNFDLPKTTVTNLEDPKITFLNEKSSTSSTTQPHLINTKEQEYDIMTPKLTSSVTKDDLMPNQFTEYDSSILYPNVPDVSTTETIFVQLLTQQSDTIASGQFTTTQTNHQSSEVLHTNMEESSVSTAIPIIQHILSTVQETVQKTDSERSTDVPNYQGSSKMHEILTEKTLNKENIYVIWEEINTISGGEIFVTTEKSSILKNETTKPIEDIKTETKNDETLLEEIVNTYHTKMITETTETVSRQSTDSALESYFKDDSVSIQDTTGSYISELEILKNQLNKYTVADIIYDKNNDTFATESTTTNTNHQTEPTATLNTDVLRDTINDVLSSVTALEERSTQTPNNVTTSSNNESNIQIQEMKMSSITDGALLSSEVLTSNESAEETSNTESSYPKTLFTEKLYSSDLDQVDSFDLYATTEKEIGTAAESIFTNNISETNISSSDRTDFSTNINELQTDSTEFSTIQNVEFPLEEITDTKDISSLNLHIQMAPTTQHDKIKDFSETDDGKKYGNNDKYDYGGEYDNEEESLYNNKKHQDDKDNDDGHDEHHDDDNDDDDDDGDSDDDDDNDDADDDGDAGSA
ncbi:protein PFC0760c-like [Anoplophora glabripennis]|uniref:protein PFC0760c-like n=1 Tax=Anoplophora glabripennis TaxID=217634 RepID=UPI00087439D2|nr:protein PFC0760c-like [Anoplophora glabripennis]